MSTLDRDVWHWIDGEFQPADPVTGDIRWKWDCETGTWGEPIPPTGDYWWDWDCNGGGLPAPVLPGGASMVTLSTHQPYLNERFPTDMMMFGSTDGTVSGSVSDNWPTGPGVTARVNLLVDGQDHGPFLLPDPTGAIRPIMPATQEEFQAALGLDMGCQIVAMSLAPGTHTLSLVGLDDQNVQLWQADTPYTVVSSPPVASAFDMNDAPIASGTLAQLHAFGLYDPLVPPGNRAIAEVPFASFAYLGATHFGVLVTPTPTSIIPDAVFRPGLDVSTPGWEAGAYWAVHFDPATTGTVDFVMEAIDDANIVVATYEATYTITG